MLRIVVLSMLLGALALTGGLTQFFSPPTNPGRDIPSTSWDATAATVDRGVAQVVDGKLTIELIPSTPGQGVGIVSLPDWQFAAKSYPYLHIALEGSSQNLKPIVVWKNTTNPNDDHFYAVENALHESLWLATNEMKGWEGEIHSLRLVISGERDDTVVIEDFSLFGASLSSQLRAIYSDFFVYFPWSRAAMNSHTGVTNVASFYPVPLVVAYLTLCLIAYGALLLMFRAQLQFDWQVPVVIFLACWIILDLSWQNRLFHQLADTYRTFSGKSTVEKLAVGPDAELFTFVSEVKQRLEPGKARIFVASSDQYSGMRSAYYLYPFNVFWSLHGKELPHKKFMQSGDYIVSIKPTETQYDNAKERVSLPGKRGTNATVIFSDPLGTLYRVN